MAFARAAGGGRTVPVFVTAGGAVLPDSADILRWADTRLAPERRLYPGGATTMETAALERWFDGGLGPDGRRWMYHHLLPVVDELSPWALAGLPGWERRAFSLAGRWLEPVIRRYLKVDAGTASASLARVDRVFDDVAERMSDGRAFLVGDRFTAADLTFAALAAPVLLPERYGSPLPPLAVLPASVVRDVERLRAHPAGVYALRLYREERPQPVPVPLAGLA
jgi:glutathione S-transferase